MHVKDIFFINRNCEKCKNIDNEGVRLRKSYYLIILRLNVNEDRTFITKYSKTITSILRRYIINTVVVLAYTFSA